jgi:hypothetical protein
MAKLEPARWWTIRRAQNRKPSTYRCPLCNGFLPALSEHVLIAPEGDTARRRHAHTACAVAARKQGRLPTRDEWRKASGEATPGLFARLAARLRRR